ncbi:hypothetical protein EMPG_11018 [Blastomyces silverae]|uniref:Uncharacterized protein n=1 Tax=Blastomyces silverae TaxID=2060906 RepID=A0A0H1B344_9EURO|nr:hypothetical protein EMPG_11018 [Blastomyces silverae]
MSNPRRMFNSAGQGNPASSQTTNNQPGTGSRWSPDSSSPDSSRPATNNQPPLVSHWSPDSSSPAASTTEGSAGAQTVDNAAATYGPVESNTTNTTVPDDVADRRRSALEMLERGGAPDAPASGRAAADSGVYGLFSSRGGEMHGASEQVLARRRGPSTVADEIEKTLEKLEGRR